jgi:hypothetical protein
LLKFVFRPKNLQKCHSLWFGFPRPVVFFAVQMLPFFYGPGLALNPAFATSSAALCSKFIAIWPPLRLIVTLQFVVVHGHTLLLFTQAPARSHLPLDVKVNTAWRPVWFVDVRGCFAEATACAAVGVGVGAAWVVVLPAAAALSLW